MSWGAGCPGSLSLAYFLLDLCARSEHARAYHLFLNGEICRAFLHGVTSGIKEGNVLRVAKDAFFGGRESAGFGNSAKD